MFWLRRRIPAKLVEFMGRKELKFSLKTKDWDEAVLLCNEENMKLERMWHEHLHGRPYAELTRSRATEIRRPSLDRAAAWQIIESMRQVSARVMDVVPRSKPASNFVPTRIRYLPTGMLGDRAGH
ncbi:hypothetical protein ABIF74_010946 [Bradyrhizobium japonicum]